MGSALGSSICGGTAPPTAGESLTKRLPMHRRQCTPFPTAANAPSLGNDLPTPVVAAPAATPVATSDMLSGNEKEWFECIGIGTDADGGLSRLQTLQNQASSFRQVSKDELATCFPRTPRTPRVLSDYMQQAVCSEECAGLDNDATADMCRGEQTSLKCISFGFGGAKEIDEGSTLSPDQHSEGMCSISSGDNEIDEEFNPDLQTTELGDIVVLTNGVPHEYSHCPAIVTKLEESHCTVAVLDESRQVAIGECWPCFSSVTLDDCKLRLGTRVVINGMVSARNKHLNCLTGIIAEHPREGHPSFIQKKSCPDQPRLAVCVVFDSPIVARTRSALLEPQFLTAVANVAPELGKPASSPADEKWPRQLLPELGKPAASPADEKWPRQLLPGLGGCFFGDGKTQGL